MLSMMLDTSVCIRALRDRPNQIKMRLQAGEQHLCISTVVLYELYVGGARSREVQALRPEIDEFFTKIAILPFDEEAAFHAAEIRVDLRDKGQLIGPNDLLIAGHARSRNLKLITGNLREFSRVDGLRCEDWL